MTENQQPGPWQQNQPANDGTWAPPPEPTNPPYQPGAANPPTTPYPTGNPYQPPQQPAQPYQPQQQPYQPGSAYPNNPTYPAGGYEPTYPQPGAEQPGYGQPVSGQPTSAQPTSAQPGFSAQPGYDQPGYAQPGYAQPGYGQPEGYAQPGYPQTVGTPWGAPTPPPQKRRTGMIVAIVVVVMVVLCGGGIAVALATGGDKDKSKNTTATDGPTKKATPVIANGDGDGLKAHLIPRPSGAKKLKVEDSEDGVFDLDGFIKAAFSGDSNEKDLLEQRKFQIAAEEQWISKGIETHVQLVQFGESDGAESYVVGQHSAYVGDSTVTAHYTLSGVTDGYGYEEHALDKDGDRRATLMCRVNNIVVVVFIFTPGSFDRDAEFSVIKKQVDALSS